LPIRDILLATSVPVLWGVGFALAKPAVAHFPPMLMLCFAYLTMAALLRWRFRGARTPRWQMFCIALLLGPIQGGLLMHGLQNLDASIAVLLLQMQVPIAILVAWPLLHERPRPAALVGTVVALAGIVLILGTPSQPPDLQASAMVLAAAASWSCSQVLVRRWSREDGPTMSVRVATYALPLGLAGSFLVETGQVEAIATAGLREWAAVAGVAILGYVLSYLIWYSLLARLRVDRLMPFVLLMPVITVTIGVLAYGEPFSWGTLAGGLLVLAGLALVVVRRVAQSDDAETTLPATARH